MTRFGSAMERIDERIPGIDLPLLSVSQTRGVIRRSELTSAPQRAESLDVYKVCRANDIVFNKMSIRAGAMGVAAEDGLVTYHYEVMRPKVGTEARFIAYLMKSAWFTEELIKRERGIGAGDQANVRTTEVPFSVLRTIDAYIPEESEQRAIADYLDHETTKIDTLITKQEALIETLSERRRSLISHTIGGASKRLPLRRVAEVIDCAHVTAEFVDDDDRYPVASIAECQGATVDLSRCKYTTTEFFDLLRGSERAPRVGDLLFIRNASVGLVSVIAEGTPAFAVGQETVLLRRRDGVDPFYLRYALNGAEASHAIEGAMIGSTFRRINVSAIRALPVPTHPYGEQSHIVGMLDEETAKIDTVIAKAEEFIALAKERRAALITAAVTGQIDMNQAA